jgi:uncharacterized membrane protein YphA (DoxX/SURF4 family)
MSAATATQTRFEGSSAQRWMSFGARIILAGVLISAGWLKVVNPHEAAAAVQAYRLLPTGVATYVGYGLPIFEILLGIVLLIGLRTRIAAIVTAILMTIFIVGVASAWARGLSIDCGCFGGGGVVAKGHTHYAQEILRDLLFVGLSVWLIRLPASALAVNPTGVAPPLPTFDGHDLDDDDLDDDDDDDDLDVDDATKHDSDDRREEPAG